MSARGQLTPGGVQGLTRARRVGTAALRDVVPADLTALADRLPALAAIAFNGERSERLAMRHHPALAARYRLLRLPQSSPARAMPAGEKEKAWSVLRDLL